MVRISAAPSGLESGRRLFDPDFLFPERFVILKIDCNDGRAMVEVTAGARKVVVDGREVPVDWVRIGVNRYSLILDGHVYDFIIDLSDSGCSVSGHGGEFNLQVEDARRAARAPGVEGAQNGPQRIKAEMPGKVIRVLVKAGDTVACDQGLLVLEAMKMQNEIRAPRGGVVREIAVSPGTAVNTGEFLISLE